MTDNEKKENQTMTDNDTNDMNDYNTRTTGPVNGWLRLLRRWGRPT